MEKFEKLYDLQQLHVETFELNYDLKNIQNLPWVISDLGKHGKRLIDTNYRKSVQYHCTIPETNVANRFTSPDCWKALKYQNGFFKQHVDHQVNPKHKGIEILLPPSNKCFYQGGQLIANNQKICPHEKKWTWIYLPLGMIHSVNQVKGTRISFVRAVYGKDDFAYDRQAEGIKAIAIEN